MNVLDELGAARICSECIGEAYLNAAAMKLDEQSLCDYCKDEGSTVSLAWLSEAINGAFDRHFVRTSPDADGFESMMLRDKESSYEWYREGEETVRAISEAAQVEENVASSIQLILDEKHYCRDAVEVGEETEFSSEAHYLRKPVDDWTWNAEWEDFEQLIKTRSRYFGPSAHGMLERVFGGIDKLFVGAKRPVLVTAGPLQQISALVRARCFQDDSELRLAMGKPDLHLAPPPFEFATAGRMNAHGISVFYGSLDRKTAIAEVRPPVGSKVLTAKFCLNDDIRLLDLTAISELKIEGSVFDPDYSETLQRTEFLNTLARRISKPVVPNAEPLEYIATQAISEFLATEVSPCFDGVIFPSVQSSNESKNVVLFHHAARVLEMEDVIQGSSDVELGLDDDDEYSRGYSVFAKTKPEAAIREGQDVGDGLNEWLADNQIVSRCDNRTAKLEVDRSTLIVHVIGSVEYTAVENEVSWYDRPPSASGDIGVAEQKPEQVELADFD